MTQLSKEEMAEYQRNRRKALLGALQKDGALQEIGVALQEKDVKLDTECKAVVKPVFKLSDSDRSSGYLCSECKLRYTNSWHIGFKTGRGLDKKDTAYLPDVGTDCVKCGVQHEKGWMLGVMAGRRAGPVDIVYPNYDINPAHKEGCNCDVCSGGFDKKEVVKELKSTIKKKR